MLKRILILIGLGLLLGSTPKLAQAHSSLWAHSHGIETATNEGNLPPPVIVNLSTEERLEVASEACQPDAQFSQDPTACGEAKNSCKQDVLACINQNCQGYEDSYGDWYVTCGETQLNTCIEGADLDSVNLICAPYDLNGKNSQPWPQPEPVVTINPNLFVAIDDKVLETEPTAPVENKPQGNPVDLGDSASDSSGSGDLDLDPFLAGGNGQSGCTLNTAVQGARDLGHGLFLLAGLAPLLFQERKKNNQ